MKKIISLSLLLILSLALVSCAGKEEDTPALLLTDESVTAEQMETLKAEALSWQSAWFGTTNKAELIAIEPADGSDQQVYISFQLIEEVDGLKKPSMTPYERWEIQAPDGTRARIFQATGGAGSGEFIVLFKFETEDSAWIEAFEASRDEGIPRIWRNMIHGKYNVIQRGDFDWMLDMTPEERESWTNLFD
jgi:hypothetical protein